MDRLKLLREALPLDGEFAHIWLHINKVIDQLHIANHKVIIYWFSTIILIFKRPECKTLYNPQSVLRDFPDANLMVCEQTFSWMGKERRH